MLIVMCTLSSFKSVRPPAGQYVGTIEIGPLVSASISGSSSALSGTYRVFSQDSDKTIVKYIIKPNLTGLVYATGEFFPDTDWVIVKVNNEIVYSGYLNPAY